MIKRLLFVLMVLMLVACDVDSLPVIGSGSSEPTVAGTRAPTPTINSAFLQPEPTEVPPTATPTLVPTTVPTPSPTPDPLGDSAEFSNDTLGVTFAHPVAWVVESASETMIVAGVSDGVVASRSMTRTKPTQLLLSISAEQSNSRNPLSILANNEPQGDISFTTFPESVPFEDGSAAHSVAEVVPLGGGTPYVAETYAVVVGDDAYMIEFTQGIDSAESNALLIDRIVESFVLSGVDREAILGTLLQEQETIDAGEMFIDQVVTGTLSASINHIIGLSGFGTYLIATVADEADVVMTISSNLEPDVPLLTVNNSSGGQAEAITWRPPFDGGYTINLQDFSFSGGAYAMTVQRVRPESNLLPAITTRPNTTPIVYIEPSPAFDPEFKLVNNQDVPILFVDQQGPSQAEIAVPIDLQSGTYQIDLGAATGAVGVYTSTVVYVPDSFTAKSLSQEYNVSTPLATNTITAGVTNLKTHYITVSSNLPHVLIANASQDADAVIRVRNLDGTERMVIDDYSTGEIETRIVNLPVGSYIVEVENFHGPNANYVVGFHEFFPAPSDKLEFDLGPEADALVIAAPEDDFDAVLLAQDVNFNQVAERDGGFDGAPEVFILQAGRTVPRGTYTAVVNGFAETRGNALLGVVYVDQAFLDVGNR